MKMKILLFMGCVLTAFAVFFSLSKMRPRPVVLVTGYWPVTNEMLRPLSHNPQLNSAGWQGRNWQNTGYDVYAYFPTFSGGTNNNPKGDGDFEVDYQDTFDDFQRLTETHRPAAILSYGQGRGPWEIEVNYPYYPTWHSDYAEPNQPDAVGDWTQNESYQTSLPVEAIQAAVTKATADLNVWIDTEQNPGDFLCGYLGWLGSHYQANNDHCKAAGFIHVGPDVDLETAVKANEATLKAIIEHLKSLR